MKKKVMNILLGAKTEDNELFISGLKYTIEKGDDIKIARIDVCESVEEIDAVLEKGMYDILICLDLLGDRSIAYGSIKEWKKNDNLKRIILVVKNEKKSSLKLGRLYQNSYYDAVFMKHLSDSELMTELILYGRTEEEAIAYYQIENMEIVRQVKQERETAKQGENIQKEPEKNFDNDNREDIRKGFDETLKNVNEQMGAIIISEDEAKENQQMNYSGFVHQKNEEKFKSFEEDMRGIFKENNIPVKSGGKKRILKGEEISKEMIENGSILNMETDMKEHTISKSNNATENILSHKAENVETENYKSRNASVILYEAYIVAAVSDSALIIEIPKANFGKNKSKLSNLPVNVILPQVGQQ